MSAPILFDPREGPPGGWPQDQAQERAYLEAFAQHGSSALIANLRTRVMGLRRQGRIFPITVNDAEYGDSYVCLPHTAYALYAKEELSLVDAGPWTPALGLLADGAGAALRAARANRIVHLNNWMLSTNLHGSWDGADLDAIRDTLIHAFPDHLISVRSLNAWSDAALCQRFRDAGWKMLPSRQIYVTDDLAADWAPRRDAKRDLALLSAHETRIDTLETLRHGDAERIAQLYAMLYLERYSKLNPAFTPAYIDMTHRAKIFDYYGLRDANGVLSCIAGCFVRGGVLTTPILGYDTSRPAADGLYRIASALFAKRAMEQGLRLHGSAGAASFKRNRGARPVVEYAAFFVDHVSHFRRGVISAAASALNTIAVPLLQERRV